MKVFKIFDADYVYAEDSEQATYYYRNNICDEEIEHDSIKEVDVNVMKMMYAIDKDSIDDLTKFMFNHPKERFECGYDNRIGFFVIWLKLSEVIEIDKPTGPYIICSTEY